MVTSLLNLFLSLVFLFFDLIMCGFILVLVSIIVGICGYMVKCVTGNENKISRVMKKFLTYK